MDGVVTTWQGSHANVLVSRGRNSRRDSRKVCGAKASDQSGSNLLVALSGGAKTRNGKSCVSVAFDWLCKDKAGGLDKQRAPE